MFSWPAVLAPAGAHLTTTRYEGDATHPSLERLASFGITRLLVK